MAGPIDRPCLGVLRIYIYITYIYLYNTYILLEIASARRYPTSFDRVVCVLLHVTPMSRSIGITLASSCTIMLINVTRIERETSLQINGRRT